MVTLKYNTARAQTTSRPAYPPSAQTNVIVEKRSRSNANSGPAPSRSCTLAAVTTTANSHPQASTAMCRFLPLIFLPPSKPLLAAPTVSAALTVWASTEPAVGNSLRPTATRSRPRSRSTNRCGRPREVHRQRPPLDAVLGHVADRVEHRPHLVDHRASGTTTQLGHHRPPFRREDRPLGIGHIRRVARHALPAHAAGHAATGLLGLGRVNRHPEGSWSTG